MERKLVKAQELKGIGHHNKSLALQPFVEELEWYQYGSHKLSPILLYRRPDENKIKHSIHSS